MNPWQHQWPYELLLCRLDDILPEYADDRGVLGNYLVCRYEILFRHSFVLIDDVYILNNWGANTE